MRRIIEVPTRNRTTNQIFTENIRALIKYGMEMKIDDIWNSCLLCYHFI